QAALERLQQLLILSAVVERAEVRRDAGFQREAGEQRLAEGVDRLDLQTARRIEHAGKEAAGAGRLLGLGGTAEQGMEVLLQSSLVMGGPAAQAAGQALAHLGRGGLG